MPKGAGILALIGGMPKKGADEEQESEHEGLEMAAQDMISAMKAGDAAAFASAFRRAHEECASGYSSEEEGEPGEE